MALALVAMFQAVFLLVYVGLPLRAAAGVGAPSRRLSPSR